MYKWTIILKHRIPFIKVLRHLHYYRGTDKQKQLQNDQYQLNINRRHSSINQPAHQEATYVGLAILAFYLQKVSHKIKLLLYDKSILVMFFFTNDIIKYFNNSIFICTWVKYFFNSSSSDLVGFLKNPFSGKSASPGKLNFSIAILYISWKSP